MLEPAVVTALVFIIMLWRLNIRRVAGLAWIVDPVILALHTRLFIGTYAGMMTGLLSGLIVSLVLLGVKRTIGVEKLTMARGRGRVVPSFEWREIKP